MSNSARGGGGGAVVSWTNIFFLVSPCTDRNLVAARYSEHINFVYLVVRENEIAFVNPNICSVMFHFR